MLERLQSALKTVKDSKRNYYAFVADSFICIFDILIFFNEIECMDLILS